MHYLGIRKQSMYILMLLGKETGISMKNIYLVLKKIRRNSPFIELSYEFGLSEPQLARIFKENILLISSYIKQFIFWRNKKDIQSNLPINFRFRYKNLQSIIDCFEIKIEKTSDSSRG